MRRPSCPVVLPVLLALSFVDEALAKKPKPTACDPGRFVVAGEALVPGATSSPDVVAYGTAIAIDSGCGGVAGRVKATKKGTVVKATWASCAGITGKATLQAKIGTDCATMSGTFRAKRAKVKRKFTAARSRCGDGSLDVAGGEACEGTSGCTTGTCTTTCACVPPGGGDNAPPVAVLTAGATVAAGTPLAFDGSGSSDPDGDPLTFGWDFGDGGRGGAVQLAHVFATAGSYAVTLTVADGRGGTASTQQTITVTEGPAPGPTVAVAGHVETVGGGALSSVTVALAGSTLGTTNGQGDVTVNVPTGVPVVLRLSRTGYVDHLEHVQIPPGGGDAVFEAAMMPQGAVQVLADAAAGGTVNGDDGAVLQVPANALVDDDGAPVTGAVQVALTPVDPTAQPQAFPGAFAGILPDGGEGLLLSGGTVEFDLGQGGGGVNLAPGARATIELPVYATLKPDGTPLVPGDVVPLWALDEQTGMWVQEGTGTVVTSANSPTGLALRGEVGHLSWWNLDYMDEAPYDPKPKCCIDTNLDGTCEDLSLTGYCWHYGTGPDQPEPFGPFADEPKLPAFLVETNLPAQGGASLPFPANRDFLLYSTYQAGTYSAITPINGASGVSEEKLIVLQPAGGAATPITVPYDQVHVLLQEGEVDRYVFTAAQDDPIYVTVSRSASGLNAQVFLDGPGANDIGPVAMGSNPVKMGFLAPVSGDYRIAIEATGGIFDEDGAAYRLEVKPTGTFPLVVSRTPLPDATGVASSATVSVTFTVPINAATVTDSTFKVENPGGTVTGTRMVNGDTITFTPTDPLSAGVPHTVTLTTGIQATGGTGLPTQVSWSFSTVDQVGVAAIIATGTEPRIAVDQNGNAFALMTSGSALRDMSVSRYTPGSGWTATQTLRQGESIYSSRIAVTPSGDSAVAVWRQSVNPGGGAHNVYASRWTQATGWSAAQQIDDLATNPASGGTGNGDNRGLELAMDAAGNAIAVWNDPNGNGVTQDRIYWNRYAVGSGWQGEQEIGNVGVGGQLLPPDIAMNATGTGVITWAVTPLGEMTQVIARRFTGAGATLAAAEPLTSPGGYVFTVSAAVDPTGVMFVLYRSGGNVWVRRWDPDTTTWEAEVPLRTADGGSAGFGCTDDDEIGVADDGTALATGCAVGTSITYRVQFTPDSGSGSWATPAATLYDQPIVDVSSTVEANGDAWAMAMPIANNVPAQLWKYRAAGPQAGWDAMPTPITAIKNNGSGISGAGSRPRVWVGAGGHAFAANYYYEGTGSKVVVVRLE